MSQILPDTISIETPYLCKITKILKVNSDRQFLTAILIDRKEQEILGFFYTDLFRLLQNVKVVARLPIEITVLKGEFKSLTAGKQFLEIHHAILENNTYINSNLLGTHEYCPMQTYLKAYVSSSGEPNNNLLWGNIIHDYLSNIFESSAVKSGTLNPKALKDQINSAVIKACYQNWQLFVVLGKDVDEVIFEFSEQFLQKEILFVQQEMEKYTEEFGKFEFVCEKMIYSRNLGLQGRIDRLIQDRPFTRFSLYETKTGTSSHSSINNAYYQCLAYATILHEYYPSNAEKLFIEYPRNTLQERLIEREYNEENVAKLFKNRNEIWSILIGTQPKEGPYQHCTRCFSKVSCSFYCYRREFANGQELCKAHREKCDIYNYFEENAEKRALFRRINAYLTWFYSHLDHEFTANLKIINEVHMSAEQREARGNCIGNLTIDREAIGISRSKGINQQQNIKELSFFKENNVEIQNTRLRKGDYVLVTPQQFVPLTSETFGAIIQEVGLQHVSLQLLGSIKAGNSFFDDNVFRIDITTSNFMVRLQKGAIDKFIRNSITKDNKNITRLRELLLFESEPKSKSVPDHLSNFEDDTQFDKSQQKAIRMSLKSKDLTLIQGPPGTGKTTLIVEIVSRLLKQFQTRPQRRAPKTLSQYSKDQRGDHLPPIRPVLLTAFTNKAIDTLVGKLIEKHPKLKVIRLGVATSIDNPLVKARNLNTLCEMEVVYPSGEKETVTDPLRARLILKSAEVIAATTTKAGSYLLQNFQFDTVIIDEAGQITEPSALIPLVKGERFILVGDHQQLPPIQIGALDEPPSDPQALMEKLGFSPERGLGISIFERLAQHYVKSKNFILLSYQYRMNKVISTFISEAFYQGRLQPGTVNQKSIGDATLEDYFLSQGIPKVEGEGYPELCFDPEKPMVFLDTVLLKSYDSSDSADTRDMESRFNDTEANIIVKIIIHLLQHITKTINTLPALLEILNDIGIISAFRSQNQKIQIGLRHRLTEQPLPNMELNEKMIDHILENIVIDTVDRFQGQEREIIIYSFVDANSEMTLHGLNTETRRLNVALSRAKKKVIFVGHSPTLAHMGNSSTQVTRTAKQLHKRLFQYIKDHGGYTQIMPGSDQT